MRKLDKDFFQELGSGDLFRTELVNYVHVNSGGQVSVACAASLDYNNATVRAIAPDAYCLVAHIMVRTAGAYAVKMYRSQQPRHRVLKMIANLHARAAYAMRQAALASLYAGSRAKALESQKLKTRGEDR